MFSASDMPTKRVAVVETLAERQPTVMAQVESTPSDVSRSFKVSICPFPAPRSIIALDFR